MCDSSKEIKLCTCLNKVTKDKNVSTWTLKRYFMADWMALEGGRCGLMAYNSNEQDIADLLGLHLNTEDCFDFDYQPAEQDVLNLNIVISSDKTVKYEFVFRNGQWELAESISAHLNSKLVVNRGYVNPLVQVETVENNRIL